MVRILNMRSPKCLYLGGYITRHLLIICVVSPLCKLCICVELRKHYKDTADSIPGISAAMQKIWGGQRGSAYSSEDLIIDPVFNVFAFLPAWMFQGTVSPDDLFTSHMTKEILTRVPNRASSALSARKAHIYSSIFFLLPPCC